MVGSSRVGSSRQSFADENAVDLAQLLGREFQVLQRGYVVVHLRHFARAHERASDARIAQHPRYRHLRQRLSSLPGDLIESANLGKSRLANVLLLQKEIACSTRVAGNSLQIAIRQQSLRQRTEDDCSHTFLL